MGPHWGACQNDLGAAIHGPLATPGRPGWSFHMALGREGCLEGSGELQETICNASGRPDGRWRDLPEIYLFKKNVPLIQSGRTGLRSRNMCS